MKNYPGSTDILFILEAPNKGDTYNPKKKYLTIEPDADPTGRFFYDLFIKELQFPIEDLFVTNSVLCLPVDNNGKNPVTPTQQLNCVAILRRMINVFNPLVVCPLGGKALLATSRLNEHGYKDMATSVAKPTSWYGRTLFPLYHLSQLARKPPYGRPEYMQRADWRSLRAIWESLKARQKHPPDGLRRR